MLNPWYLHKIALPARTGGSKLITIKIFIGAAVLFTCLFQACSEDPVKQNNPPEPVDTVNRYDWSIDTINTYNLRQVYVADTNNIFMASYPAPIYYDGETYQQINVLDPLFRCINVGGFDKDNVFFGGSTWGTYWGDLVLKKWTSGSITSYTVTGDSGVKVVDIFSEGPDQCWISTAERYKVYYFNSGLFTSYNLDSGYRIGIFYKDLTGNLFVFPFKVIDDSNYAYIYYKFIDNNFQAIGADTVNMYDEPYGMMRCGLDFIRLGKNSIYYFNGRNWSMHSNTEFLPRYIGGTSKDNLVCYGQSESGHYRIYTWNGIKWKQEYINNIYYGIDDGIDIEVSQNTANIVISVINVYYAYNFHIKGRLKAK